MQNDSIEARLRRDTTLLAFLQEQKTHYADLEDDVAGPREQLGRSLEQAQVLSEQALTADSAGNPDRKRGIRNQLTELLKRLVAGLKAVGTGTNDLRLQALAGQPSKLSKLPETTFAEEARRLLSLVPERSAALAKRRFTPEHYQQAQKLLQEFRAAATEGRLHDTAGTAGRQGLERLLKENGRLVERLTNLLAVYAPDAPDFWNAYKAAARVVKRGGQEGPDKVAEQ